MHGLVDTLLQRLLIAQKETHTFVGRLQQHSSDLPREVGVHTGHQRIQLLP